MMFHPITHCIYQRLDGDVHHLLFTHASRQGVDEFFAHCNAICHTTRPPGVARLLVDFRQDGMPAAFYFFDQMRGFFGALAPGLNARAAYLFAQPAMMRATEILLVRMNLPHLVNGFFLGDDAEVAALKWLAEPQPQPASWNRNFLR